MTTTQRRDMLRRLADCRAFQRQIASPDWPQHSRFTYRLLNAGFYRRLKAQLAALP